VNEPPIRLTFDGSVARVTLARPPLNVLTLDAIERLDAALQVIGRRAGMKVLVLAAEGRAFCAGVAVEDHLGDRAESMLAAFHGIFRALHALECVTVAAVQGAALGGGAELAAFCDFVIASERATFGQPEIKVGVFPPIAALHYPARIGLARTLQLLVSGETLGAPAAERIGLVDRVVPAPDLEAAVSAVVAGVTDKSAAILRLTKQAVRRAQGDRFDRSLSELEWLYLRRLMQTEDAEEGLRAFLEKRQPVWKNR
jgi:cyclohexa-1,5-dienecarbonyl-CoA hydratase